MPNSFTLFHKERKLIQIQCFDTVRMSKFLIGNSYESICNNLKKFFEWHRALFCWVKAYLISQVHEQKIQKTVMYNIISL
jgi:hypothetical protein